MDEISEDELFFERLEEASSYDSSLRSLMISNIVQDYFRENWEFDVQPINDSNCLLKLEFKSSLQKLIILEHHSMKLKRVV